MYLQQKISVSRFGQVYFGHRKSWTCTKVNTSTYSLKLSIPNNERKGEPLWPRLQQQENAKKFKIEGMTHCVRVVRSSTLFFNHAKGCSLRFYLPLLIWCQELPFLEWIHFPHPAPNFFTFPRIFFTLPSFSLTSKGQKNMKCLTELTSWDPNGFLIDTEDSY